MPPTGGLAARPHLGGEKGLRLRLHLAQELAHDGLGTAVHRRGIDHLAAGLEQGRQHLPPLLELTAIGADVERLPGAKSHDRQRLLALRNGARQHGRPRLQRLDRPQSGCRRHGLRRPARGSAAKGKTAGAGAQADELPARGCRAAPVACRHSLGHRINWVLRNWAIGLAAPSRETLASHTWVVRP